MNVKSIIISTAYFLVIYVLTGAFIMSLVSENNLVGSALMIFVWCSPGYLAASIAKVNGVLNAMASAVLSSTIIGIIIFAFPHEGISIKREIALLSSSVVWFGLGAVIWHFKKWVLLKNA